MREEKREGISRRVEEEAYVWKEGSRRSVTKVDEMPPGPMIL